MNTEVTYEIPKWGVILLKMVTIIMIFAFFFLGWKWPESEPVYFKYFFFIVSFVSLVALYRLHTWNHFIVFRATERGMYFPCPKLRECDSEFLFIQWRDIKNIKTKKFLSSAGTSLGVSIDIRMSLKDKSQYFPELRLKEHQEWLTVGFTEAFLNKKRTVGELNQMKKNQ